MKKTILIFLLIYMPLIVTAFYQTNKKDCSINEPCSIGDYVYYDNSTPFNIPNCSITMSYINGTNLVQNASMSYDSYGFYNYSFTPTVNTIYVSYMYCDLGISKLMKDETIYINATPRKCTLNQSCSLGDLILYENLSIINKDICNITIYYPNGTMLVNNTNMSYNNLSYYNYTYIPTIDSSYRSFISCLDNGFSYLKDTTFYINKTPNSCELNKPCDLGNFIWQDNQTPYAQTGCNITITYPNSTMLINSSGMTYDSYGFYNYSFTPTITGYYNSFMYCNFTLNYIKRSLSFIVNGSPNECQLQQPCYLGDYVYYDNLTPFNADICNITLYYPNGTLIINNVNMTYDNYGFYNYSYIPQTEGIYNAFMTCINVYDIAKKDLTFFVNTTIPAIITTDTTQPTFINIGQNLTSPQRNQWIMFSANISDETALNYTWQQNNCTGYMINETPVARNGVLSINHTNSTYITLTDSQTCCFRFFGNDSSGNLGTSSETCFNIADITPPFYTNNNSNITNGLVNNSEWVILFFNATDNVQLNYTWSGNNFSGTWINETPVARAGLTTYNHTNITKVTADNNKIICWQGYMNDSSGNFNQTGIMCFNTTILNIPPIYQDIGLNHTLKPLPMNEWVTLYVNWTDTDLNYTWVGTNFSGTWINETPIARNGLLSINHTNSSYFSTMGCYQFFANDSAGQQNQTDVFCINPAIIINETGNWYVNLSDAIADCNCQYLGYHLISSSPSLAGATLNWTSLIFMSNLTPRTYISSSLTIKGNNVTITDLNISAISATRVSDLNIKSNTLTGSSVLSVNGCNRTNISYNQFIATSNPTSPLNIGFNTINDNFIFSFNNITSTTDAKSFYFLMEGKNYIIHDNIYLTSYVGTEYYFNTIENFTFYNEHTDIATSSGNSFHIWAFYKINGSVSINNSFVRVNSTTGWGGTIYFGTLKNIVFYNISSYVLSGEPISGKGALWNDELGTINNVTFKNCNFICYGVMSKCLNPFFGANLKSVQSNVTFIDSTVNGTLDFSDWSDNSVVTLLNVSGDRNINFYRPATVIYQYYTRYNFSDSSGNPLNNVLFNLTDNGISGYNPTPQLLNLHSQSNGLSSIVPLSYQLQNSTGYFSFTNYTLNASVTNYYNISVNFNITPFPAPFGVEQFNFTLVSLGAPSTCTYSGTGNFKVDCGENCIWNTDINLGKNNQTIKPITAQGTVILNANIYNFTQVYIERGCTVYATTNHGFKS